MLNWMTGAAGYRLAGPCPRLARSIRGRPVAAASLLEGRPPALRRVGLLEQEDHIALA